MGQENSKFKIFQKFTLTTALYRELNMIATVKHCTTILFAILLVSCGGGGSVGDFCIELYTPGYAGGFQILGAEGRQSTIIRTHNPWQGADGIDTELFVARDGETPPAGFAGQVVRTEPQRIICMSSTHIAMLDAIGAVGRIVGVSGADYITNEYISARRDSTGDVGYEGNIDYELIVALRPDLVLLYGLNGASSMESKLRELRIPFAYVGDYLEESPLGKAEWMVAVGEMLGRRTEAEAIYRRIPERYEALKNLAASARSPKPSVMLNTPYGDTWFMAPMTSYMAQMIADAGGDYVYKKNTTTRSLPIDMEEAALLVAQSDVWLNVGNITALAGLQRSLPRFADARCVREGRVWNCNRRINSAGGNDYWESGIVRPDVILSDLIKILHPELLPDHQLYYYRRVE